MGVIEFPTGNFGPATGKGTVVAQSSGASGSGSFTPIVFSQENATHRSVSEDTFYIAGFSNGNINFQSINAIAETGAEDAASTQVITMDGTGMDVREHFIAGDVVHIGTSVGSPAADSLIGTVASADSATQITLEAVSPTALVDGDILYNIHPIRVLLHFEK